MDNIDRFISFPEDWFPLCRVICPKCAISERATRRCLLSKPVVNLLLRKGKHWSRGSSDSVVSKLKAVRQRCLDSILVVGKRDFEDDC
jgi:hypothetical protein